MSKIKTAFVLIAIINSLLFFIDFGLSGVES
jgi:hypothetical protein